MTATANDLSTTKLGRATPHLLNSDMSSRVSIASTSSRSNASAHSDTKHLPPYLRLAFPPPTSAAPSASTSAAGYVPLADRSPTYPLTPRTGPPPSPSQPTHSSSARRRAKIDKIRRTLGEDVPIELVVPNDDAPHRSSHLHSHSRSKSHSHRSRPHVTSSSAPPIEPGLEALFQVLEGPTSPAVVRAHRRASVVPPSSSRDREREREREQMRAMDDASSAHIPLLPTRRRESRVGAYPPRGRDDLQAVNFVSALR